MIRLSRRAMLAGTGASVIGACAPEDQAADADPNQPKGGIGGTGIVGTLTDFGSLIINGLRVQLPAGLTVRSALGPLEHSQLAVGQNLTVEAARTADGLEARRVRVVHPIVGPVDDVSSDGRTLTVGGVPVVIEEGAPNQLTRRGLVAVSGAWQRSRIVASRIEPAGPTARLSVSGTLRQASTGAWTLGSVPVRLRAGNTAADGAFGTAFGTLANGAMDVAALQVGRFTGAAGPLIALSVEGYFAATKTAPFNTIDGLGHELSSKSDLSGLLDHRVLLTGSYDGRFVVEQGDILDDSFEARRARFRKLVDLQGG